MERLKKLADDHDLIQKSKRWERKEKRKKLFQEFIKELESGLPLSSEYVEIINFLYQEVIKHKAETKDKKELADRIRLFLWKHYYGGIGGRWELLRMLIDLVTRRLINELKKFDEDGFLDNVNKTWHDFDNCFKNTDSGLYNENLVELSEAISIRLAEYVLLIKDNPAQLEECMTVLVKLEHAPFHTYALMATMRLLELKLI